MGARLIVALCGVMLIVSACSPDQSMLTTTTLQSLGSSTMSAPTSTTLREPATTTLARSTTTVAPDGPMEVFVENGEVVGGVQTIVSELGAEVWILVHSDTTDHVHVHGYDLFYDVGPELPADLMFATDVPGVFEIEMEGAHLLIAELAVS